MTTIVVDQQVSSKNIFATSSRWLSWN